MLTSMSPNEQKPVSNAGGLFVFTGTRQCIISTLACSFNTLINLFTYLVQISYPSWLKFHFINSNLEKYFLKFPNFVLTG